MPFWKKSKEASGGKGTISEKTLPRSISLGGGFRRSSNFDNPGSTKGILADFLAQNENITTVDLGSAKPSMDALVRQKSRLSKTVNVGYIYQNNSEFDILFFLVSITLRRFFTTTMPWDTSSSIWRLATLSNLSSFGWMFRVSEVQHP